MERLLEPKHILQRHKIKSFRRLLFAESFTKNTKHTFVFQLIWKIRFASVDYFYYALPLNGSIGNGQIDVDSA